MLRPTRPKHRIIRIRRKSSVLSRRRQRSERSSPAVKRYREAINCKEPIHWPSGEKKGPVAPSVPGIGLASKLSMERN
jgi:hypothetical protein